MAEVAFLLDLWVCASCYLWTPTSTTQLFTAMKAVHSRGSGVRVHMQVYLPNILAYGHPVSTPMPLRWRGPESLRPDAAVSLWCHDAAAFPDHYMHLMTPLHERARLFFKREDMGQIISWLISPHCCNLLAMLSVRSLMFVRILLKALVYSWYENVALL